MLYPGAVKTEITHTRWLKRNYRAQSAATNNVKTAISANEKPTESVTHCYIVCSLAVIISLCGIPPIRPTQSLTGHIVFDADQVLLRSTIHFSIQLMAS